MVSEVNPQSEIRNPQSLGPILVAVDLGDSARTLLPTVRELEARFGARPVWLHVVERSAEFDRILHPFGRRRRAIYDRVCRDAVASIRDRLTEQGVRGAEIEVRLGRADAQVMRVVRERSVSLVALAAPARTTIRTRVLGSTADRLLRRGRCPVLVVRELAHPQWRRVLLAVDLSPHSRGVVRAGAAIARACSAELVVVYVLDELYGLYLRHLLEGTGPSQAPPPEPPEPLPRSPEEQEAFATREAEEFVGRQLEGVKWSLRILRGKPATRIVELAWEEAFDLVVLGTHGRRRLEHLVLGSVAERVLEAAHCSVLAVRPERRA